MAFIIDYGKCVLDALLQGVGQGLQPLSPLAEGEDIRPRTGLSLRPEARMGRHRPHRQACRLCAYRLQQWKPKRTGTGSVID